MPARRSLVILARKFFVVAIGALVYGQPKFAAVITAVSLFIAFVLHKAYNPYRSNSALNTVPGAVDTAPKKANGKALKYGNVLVLTMHTGHSWLHRARDNVAALLSCVLRIWQVL